MDSGTAIAFGSLAVAALAIVATTLQQARAIKAGRQLHDLESVRTVLDDAAIALHETLVALDNSRAMLTKLGPSILTEPAQRRERAVELHAAARSSMSSPSA
jgi:hypothetical protein